MRYLPEEIEYIYKMHQSKTWPANTLYKAVESCPNSIRRHPIWYINRGYIVRITQYPKSVYRLTQRVVRQCETNIILTTDPSYLVKMHEQGFSCTALSVILGISRPTIKRIMINEKEKEIVSTEC